MPELNELLRRTDAGPLFGALANRRSDFRHFPGFRDLVPYDQQLVSEVCDGRRPELTLVHQGRILRFHQDQGADTDGEFIRGYRLKTLDLAANPTVREPAPPNRFAAPPAAPVSSAPAPRPDPPAHDAWPLLVSAALHAAVTGGLAAALALAWWLAGGQKQDDSVAVDRLAAKVAERLDRDELKAAVTDAVRETVRTDLANRLGGPGLEDAVARQVVAGVNPTCS